MCEKKENQNHTRHLSRSMFIADGRLCSKGRRKVLSFSFITETKRFFFKKVAISHNKIGPGFNFSSKSFFHLSYELEYLGI